jgi:hypothetical protein
MMPKMKYKMISMDKSNTYNSHLPLTALEGQAKKEL